ncbi:hypothetical protein PENSPDRAFT_755466 [Peniophora sp. CONT]|nr:hypothetical protein PENSPDRAFT_755466 [Peniophora sp. CONT]
MDAAIYARRDVNTKAFIHRKLSNENLCDIFLALALLDIPSLERPQGWYLQVNGVCHRWRQVALRYAELWAISAGSFPSDCMTDLAIQRAGGATLCFDGHFEDYEGPGHVLTEHQLNLMEEHAARLRSFVHDAYTDWSKRFYRLKVFPQLETARIWDDSGPDMWHHDELIDAPRLHGLYLNNALNPFNSPDLRYLRIDMDNPDWCLGRNIFDLYEPMTEGCQAIPRLFPTREFIAFLKRSPQLEQLIVADMPLLLSKHLPSTSELRVELPKLNMLHLSGKSWAMGDLLQRLKVPLDTQVFIDTDSLDGSDKWGPILTDVLGDWACSPAYDSLRLSLTPTYDFLLQTWSSGIRNVSGGPNPPPSFGTMASPPGPRFTLRFPALTRDLVGPDMLDALLTGHTSPHSQNVIRINDFQLKVAKRVYPRVAQVIQNTFATFKYLDYSDAPPGGGYVDEAEYIMSLWSPSDVTPTNYIPESCKSIHITLSWSLLKQLPTRRVRLYHITQYVEDLTLVNFPCAAFPSRERYDERVNREAWDVLFEFAESASDMSNMERSDEPEPDDLHSTGSVYRRLSRGPSMGRTATPLYVLAKEVSGNLVGRGFGALIAVAGQ